MKSILIVLLCMFSSFAYSQTIGQEIKKLQKEKKIFVIYDSSIRLDAPYHGPSLKNMPVEKALDKLFRNTDITWTRSGMNIILGRKPQKQSKQQPKAKVKKKNVHRKYTISGYIKNENGEPLVNVTIYDKEEKQGTLTNEYGFFSFTLPEGTHSLRISYIGCQDIHPRIKLSGNERIDFQLQENTTLNDVIVKGDLNSPLLTTQTGKRSLTSADFNTEFSLLSSPDVIKTLQRISGVASGVDLASGLYVHGGNSDENLFLLDGTPLYQTNHSLGLFSSFNTDIIKNADFYKSGFPARYSGRLSSVTDVRTKDGDLYHYHGLWSLGLLDGRISLEGPIVKGKTSFVFSLRRSWIDLILKPIFDIANHRKSDDDKYTVGYLFHDLNFKITHHLSDRDKMYVSIYSGLDHYNVRDKSAWEEDYEDMKNNFKWGNLNLALGWDRQWGNRLFSNIAGIFTYNYSGLDYSDDNFEESDDGIRHRTSLEQQHNHSKIYDGGLKVDFDYRPDNRNKINFGGTFIQHLFKPQTIQKSYYYSEKNEAVDTVQMKSHNIKHSTELTTYAEDEMRITDQWSTDFGLNFSSFSTKGKIYHYLDPRLATKIQMRDNLSVKLSYTMMTQYVHRIATSYLDMPTDYWVPTTSTVLPARSSQVAAGIYAQPGRSWLLSIEGFYKRTRHLLLYRHWAGFQPAASRWDKDVTDGDGRSYGLEFDGNYHHARMSLQAAYTLSWTLRKYNEIGTGWFRDQFDNRHKINITWRYQFSHRVGVYAAWTYHSGNRMTLPDQYLLLPDFPNHKGENEIGKFYSKSNNMALPAYHRLDVGANFTHRTRHGREGIWNVSIYNAYCHLNTMRMKIHEKDDGTYYATTSGYIPLIPSVSYTLKF